MLKLDKISRVWNQFVNHGKMDNIIYSNFKNVIVFPLNITFIVVEDRESSQCTNEMSQVYNNIFCVKRREDILFLFSYININL